MLSGWMSSFSPSFAVKCPTSFSYFSIPCLPLAAPIKDNKTLEWVFFSNKAY